MKIDDIYGLNIMLKHMRRYVFILLMAVSLTINAEVYEEGFTVTHTLPVLYINVDGAQEIVSKEDYLGADYWLDSEGDENYKSIGSKAEPKRLQIRGRGQSTWIRWEKKPYKIKLEGKESLLGMSKNKHWALLPNAEDRSMIKNYMGFELAKRIGMQWTPSTIPVELVLNGEYWGLYFVTENIRVSKNRVNITEQKDDETNPDSISGGYLLEIDNYEEPNQIRFNDGDGLLTRFTYHSPEELSSNQQLYLETLLKNTNDAIYVDDKTSTLWENYIDMHSLAQYYVCMEMMNHIESFCGSCWMYKDLGDDEKIHFGPVWDFGVCYQEDRECFIYNNSPYPQHWIGEIAKFPRFQDTVKMVFSKVGGASLEASVDSLIERINMAAIRNYERWPKSGETDLKTLKTQIFNRYYKKLEFLKQQWGISTDIKYLSASEVKRVSVYDMAGRKLFENRGEQSFPINTKLDGLYIIETEYSDGTRINQKQRLK